MLEQMGVAFEGIGTSTLRLTPPAPRRVRFPALRLLKDLPQQEETPARTPPWLLLLRLLLAACVAMRWVPGAAVITALFLADESREARGLAKQAESARASATDRLTETDVVPTPPLLLKTVMSLLRPPPTERSASFMSLSTAAVSSSGLTTASNDALTLPARSTTKIHGSVRMP